MNKTTTQSAKKKKDPLQRLKEEVLEANLELVRRNLVIYTFGNVSGLDRERGLVVIKPSGVPYDRMKATDMVVTDLAGKVVEGRLRPSSDLATHVEIYQKVPSAHGVAHTHSTFATAFAQARRAVPCFGTTHADYVNGEIPVTGALNSTQIRGEYEKETGLAITRKLAELSHDPGMILVASHGPFTWGWSPMVAAENSVILEELAKMASLSLSLVPNLGHIQPELLARHYFRKHGENAYYGQK